MNSIIQARELTLKYLEPTLKKHSFSVKLSATKQAKIERKAPFGTDIMGFEMLNYNPSFQIMYAFSKICVPINDLLLRFQERTGIMLKVDKRTWFIFFSYNTLNKPTGTTYLPYMDTEEDVQKCVSMMNSFIGDIGIPLLTRFDDLREVDKIINGDEPWETDWHKPYVLGVAFHLKRLIISKLAGLGSYDRTYDFVTAYYTSHFSDEQYGNNFKARMHEVEELHKMLIDVKPLV
jgi:hypothetical protein